MARSFESLLEMDGCHPIFAEWIDKIDDYFYKEVPKQMRAQLLKYIEDMIAKKVYPRLLAQNRTLKGDINKLKTENAKLGQELNELMNNRKLEKKKLALLEHEILF
jgi:hypothetical protein